MTREEYLAAMALVVSYWPHYKPSPETFKAGERLLLDLPQGPVVAAIDALAVEEPEFAPGAGRIRARAVDLMDPVPDEAAAWSEVLAQVSAVGAVGTPEWSHPAVSTAVESMGWRTICHSTNREADRAHFFRIYGNVRTRSQPLALPPSVQETVASLASTLALEGGPDHDPPDPHPAP